MTTLTKLRVAEKQMDEAYKNYKQAMKHAKQEIGNIRLSKKEVADITGYSPAYLSGLDVPFHNSMIQYNDLENWIWEYKPNRLKRVKKNIKNYLP